LHVDANVVELLLELEPKALVETETLDQETGELQPCAGSALLYLAAAVSDFYIPSNDLVRLFTFIYFSVYYF